MARVIETKRCTLPITVHGENLIVEGWGVGIEADSYEEAYALARNAIRPMVERDLEAMTEREYSLPDENEEEFFRAFR